MRNRGTNPFFQPWKAPLFARIYLCLNNLKAALFLHDWPRSSKLERFQRSDGSKLRLIENLEVDSSNAEFRLIKKSSGKGFWEDRRVSSSIANGSKFSKSWKFHRIEEKNRIGETRGRGTSKYIHHTASMILRRMPCYRGQRRISIRAITCYRSRNHKRRVDTWTVPPNGPGEGRTSVSFIIIQNAARNSPTTR